MTVTDCHHEKTAVQKMEHAKNFAFGKGLQTTDIDLHSTYIKKVQKSPKNWENVGRCTSYPYFTHARKKVKIFFYIERYGNDLHRPTSFLFSSPGGKKLLPHETETSTIIVVCQSASCTSFLFYFCWFCPPVPKATVTDCHEKVQKSPKTGKKRRQCRKGNTQKISLFGKGLQMTDIDLHSTYIKKMQKSSKNWENVGRCTSYTYFTHARKKVKISST